MKFWRIKSFEDMNIFERLIFKYRLAKEMKKMCEIQKFLDNNNRVDISIPEYFEKYKIGCLNEMEYDEVEDDVCKE